MQDFHHLLPPGKEKYSGIFRTEEPTGVVKLLKGVRAYGLHLKIGTDLGRIETAVFLSTGQIFFCQGASDKDLHKLSPAWYEQPRFVTSFPRRAGSKPNIPE